MKGWRTVIFNAAACLPVIAELVLHIAALPEFRGILPKEWLPWYALALALGNMGLRAITTTPMGRSE